MGRKSMPPFSSQPESVKAKLGIPLSCAPAPATIPNATEKISAAPLRKDVLNIACSLFAGLEVRFSRHRYVIVEEVRIVLCADLLDEILIYAAIVPHCGPGLIESARIVDREDRFHSLPVIDLSPALHHVQLLAVRRAVD